MYLVAGFALVVAAELLASASVGGQSRLPAFFEPDASGTGYVLRPGQYAYQHLGRSIVVSIDDDGRRKVPGVSDAAQREVFLIGDSQVFGWGLDDSETVAAQLQKLLGPGTAVRNLGVPGTGPLHYAELVARAPSGAFVVVVFTEVNDAQDAYSIDTFGKPHCGVLVRPSGFASAVPCWLVRSHLFSTIVDIRNRLFPFRLAPPLNCNPAARSAGRVVEHRLNDVVDFLGIFDNVQTATVPWDVRLFPERAVQYSPPQTGEACTWRLPDSMQAMNAFLDQGDRATLFLPTDHHLAPEGAGLLAEIIRSKLALTGQTAQQTR